VQQPPDLSDESRASASPTSYSYKASLVGAAHQFELTDEGLAWWIGRKHNVWPYRSIAAIRLSYRPMTMQSRRFRADVENRSGEKISVLSTSWQTVALVTPQDESYRIFVQELHRRVASSGGEVTLTGGLKPLVYGIGVVLMSVVAVAMAGLLVRALTTGAVGGALFLLAFAAVFGWQIGGFLWRNKPRSYSFAAPPAGLLP